MMDLIYHRVYIFFSSLLNIMYIITIYLLGMSINESSELYLVAHFFEDTQCKRL